MVDSSVTKHGLDFLEWSGWYTVVVAIAFTGTVYMQFPSTFSVLLSLVTGLLFVLFNLVSWKKGNPGYFWIGFFIVLFSGFTFLGSDREGLLTIQYVTGAMTVFGTIIRVFRIQIERYISGRPA